MKTKFEIGDKFWIVRENYTNGEFEYHEDKVVGIILFGPLLGNGILEFYIGKDGIEWSDRNIPILLSIKSEKDCFQTREETEAECTKRNQTKEVM